MDNDPTNSTEPFQPDVPQPAAPATPTAPRRVTWYDKENAHRTRNTIITVIATLLVLSCVCASCVGIIQNISAGASTTANVQATATVKVHQTPVASHPTATSGSQQAAASAYATVVTTDLTILEDDETQMSDNCSSSYLQANGFGDCKAALQTLVADDNTFLGDLNATPAPPCLQPTDKLLREAITNNRDGAQQALNGLNDNSVAEIEAGTALVQQGNTKMNQATTAVDQAHC